MANELYSASVYNVSQIHEAMKYNLNKIYIPYDLFYTDEADIELIDKIHRETDINVYVSTPRILRKRDYKYLESFKAFLLKGKVDGVLVKNLEIIAFVEEIKDAASPTTSVTTPVHINLSIGLTNLSCIFFIRESLLSQYDGLVFVTISEPLCLK